MCDDDRLVVWLQINTVVSGALDRLHYEKDPCVKYEVNRKLWVYLHRNRTEEEFGESSVLLPLPAAGAWPRLIKFQCHTITEEFLNI